MGGNRNKRKYNHFAQKKRDKKDKAKQGDYKQTRTHYDDIIRENASFEQYYKEQGVCPPEEWELFFKSLKENLPTSFRVTGSSGEAQALLNIIKGELFIECVKGEKPSEDSPEEVGLKPFCLPWYPGGFAWQLQLTRKDIRRSEAYFRLHNFLISETSAGGISRQEAVSMIPPIVLQVEPHHKVIDMCAAPGSKTAQLIEYLHGSNCSTSDKLPTGFVVANDLDNARCYMLVHQAKRLNSPCLVVTNHDSALMPNFTMTGVDGSEQPIKFDRVLCDVPCSGDGTLRKNPDIWMKWSAANGSNLHGIQFRIVKRGVELLAVGGRLVYSTCSLNPMENEAVLHRLLCEAEGSLKIVPSSHLVPGLKFLPGLSTWRPASKDLVFYDSIEEVPEKWQTTVRPQMFPPKPEDAKKYGLENCMRILPHHQDTGAFFVAVIEKTDYLPWESAPKKLESPSANGKTENSLDTEDKDIGAESSAKTSENKSANWGPQRKKRRLGGYKEDPYVFFKENEDVWESIKTFYHLSDNFNPKCLLTRCHVGKKKNIYFCSPDVRDLVIQNEDKIKIINTGIKTFVRCDNKNMNCAFRLAQEGLLSILNYIGSPRQITLPKEDLVSLLQNTDPTTPPEIESLTDSTQAQVKDLACGSCVLNYYSDSLTLNIVGWRGTKSLRAYTAASDTIHLLRILGADISKFDVNKFKKDAIEIQGEEPLGEPLGEELTKVAGTSGSIVLTND